MELLEKIQDGSRTSGQTTRLADFYIQTLMINRSVVVIDHYPDPSASKRLATIICDRLRNEHQGLKFEYHRHKNLIKLI